MTIKTWEDQYQAKCEELEIAQGTLKNLWARVAELEAELADRRNQQPVAYRAWFDKDSGARFLFTLWPGEERLDVDWESLFLAAGAQPSMKDHEIAALVNRLTDIAKEYAGAGQLRERIAQEIRHITKGAQPRCSRCDGTGDVHSIDGEWRGVCDCGAGAQPVPEGMALDAGAKLNSCTGCYADQVIGESRPCRTCIRSGAISDRFEAAKEPK